MVYNDKCHRKPLISVIIPVYNVEKYLRRCVESVMRQTYKELEILLVDDGSTDRSSVLADELALEDSRIRVFHKENGGLSSARNYALERCGGEYLAFVDSDDWIDPETYEKAYQALWEDQSDLCCWGCIVEEKYRTRIKRPVEQKEIVTSGEFFRRMFLDDSVDNVVWNKLYHRSVYEEIRFPVGFNFEDGRTTYKVIRKAQKITLIPDVFYHYNRQNQDSITALRGVKNSLDYWSTRHILYLEFGNECDEFREAILCKCIWNIYFVWAERYKDPVYMDPRIGEIRNFITEKRGEIRRCKACNPLIRGLVLQIPFWDEKIAGLAYPLERMRQHIQKIIFTLQSGLKKM